MTKNTLLALVDGSSYAESVCHYAAWLGKKTGWRVKIYHVMGRRSAPEHRDLSGAIRLGARTKLLEQLAEMDAERAKLAQEHGRAILEDAKALVQGDSDLEVITRLRQGDLVEAITATEETGDLIVIGKRGEAAGMAMQHLGSNLERIVRATSKPVLIANRAFNTPHKVLVAFDGGPSALKAVDYIARSPIFAGMHVTLFTAGSETEARRKALDSAADILRAGGFVPDTILREGEPERLLAGLTETEGYDMLVMGAYGHSRVRTLFIGSTTTEMLRSSRVPVLMIR